MKWINAATMRDLACKFEGQFLNIPRGVDAFGTICVENIGLRIGIGLEKLKDRF